MEEKRRGGEEGREMIDCISAEEAKLADQIAIQELGIPTLKLMERAGKAVAELAASLLPDRSSPLLVLSGVGNNGGDALCAASRRSSARSRREGEAAAPREASSARAAKSSRSASSRDSVLMAVGSVVGVDVV